MTDTAISQVLANERRRQDALLAADTHTLSTLLSPDLVYVHSTAARDDLSSYLAKLQSGSLKYLSLVFDEFQAQQRADTVVVTGRMQAQVSRDGQVKTVRSVFMTVWREEKDSKGQPSWRLWAHQGTPLPL